MHNWRFTGMDCIASEMGPVLYHKGTWSMGDR